MSIEPESFDQYEARMARADEEEYDGYDMNGPESWGEIMVERWVLGEGE